MTYQCGFHLQRWRTFKGQAPGQVVMAPSFILQHSVSQSEFTMLEDDLGHGGLERLGTWASGYDSPNLNEALHHSTGIPEQG